MRLAKGKPLVSLSPLGEIQSGVPSKKPLLSTKTREVFAFG